MSRNRKHILIVDDDPIVHELLKARLIDRDGYEVTSLKCAKDAREYLRKFPPDAVLLDWNLLDEAGIRVLRWLRGRSKTMWVPVFMLTARNSMADVERCLDAGASGHFSKPVNLDMVSRKLETLFDERACACG